MVEGLQSLLCFSHDGFGSVGMYCSKPRTTGFAGLSLEDIIFQSFIRKMTLVCNFMGEISFQDFGKKTCLENQRKGIMKNMEDG